MTIRFSSIDLPAERRFRWLCSYSISAAQTVPVYLPVRYLTLIRSFFRIGMGLGSAAVIEGPHF